MSVFAVTIVSVANVGTLKLAVSYLACSRPAN